MQVITCIHGESMPEPVTTDTTLDTRQRIIEAAIQVLLKVGYARATTRRVAAVAEVNEVTIFRHFGNKVTLMATAIDEYSGNPMLERLINEDFTGNLRADLNLLGIHLVEKISKGHDMMRFMMCEGHQVPELHEKLAQSGAHRRELLTTYYDHQIINGAIRSDLDPSLLATAFTGMIFSYGMNPRSKEDTHDVLEKKIGQLVDLFLNGGVKLD